MSNGERLIPLSTPCIQSTRGGDRSKCVAHLVIDVPIADPREAARRSKLGHRPGRAALRFNGGTWSLSTLLGLPGGFSINTNPLQVSARLSIDLGQDWVCENPRELVAECLKIVLDGHTSDAAGSITGGGGHA